MVEPADAELLERWRSGDERARERLARRYYANVLRFFDVKAPRVSEDLTQQTLLECARTLDKFRADGSFKAFLFGIARNVLLRYLRGADRDALALRASDNAARDQGPTPSGLVAMREEHWLVLLAMDKLPTDLRIVLELYYWEEMSGPEIGEVLRVGLSTVTTRLGRARARLREHVLAISRPGRLRTAVAADLEGWTRALVHPRTDPR